MESFYFQHLILKQKHIQNKIIGSFLKVQIEIVYVVKMGPMFLFQIILEYFLKLSSFRQNSN